MSTFTKIYKKVANNGNDADYQIAGQVGVNGVPLDIMIGASSSADGEIGLVPKPIAGNQNKYLRADGTWQTPPDTNTTYDVFTGSNNGLVPKTSLSNVFLTSKGTWDIPWVGSWVEDSKTYVTLGMGDTTTTKAAIPEASTTQNGLMSAYDKSLLNKTRFMEAWSNSETDAWTGTDSSLSNFWPFTIGFGQSESGYPILEKVNGSTVKTLKTGFYTFNIRCLFNTYGTKRLVVGYKINNGNLTGAIRISTKSNWEEVFFYNFTDFLSENTEISFWMNAFDTGSSLKLCPLETHIYFVPWVF